MSMDACENCKFWQRLHPGDDAGYEADRNYHVDENGVGICRRFPPQGARCGSPADGPDTFAIDAALWAQWPVTSGDLDWCGEYRGK